jgi:tRNA (cmo5U34)-methyltransferase
MDAVVRTWKDEEKVSEYVGRVGRLAARAAGEGELVEHLPVQVDRVLDLARQRLADEPRVRILEHDLREPLPELGHIDVVVAGFSIHHLAHERKVSLFEEVAAILRPGGVFANLEVVQCATPELQAEFYERIERPGGDPEDVLAEVQPQLEWMRAAGLVQVDCMWRWRGFALLVGRAPS